MSLKDKVVKCAEWARGVCGYNDKGEEIPDPTPMELPIGWKAPLPLAEEIRRLVASEVMQRDLSEAGLETFEEADDFGMEDEDMSSPWEDRFDTARLFTREGEVRAGVVAEPDFNAARALKAKAEAIIAAYMKKKAAPQGQEQASAAPAADGSKGA